MATHASSALAFYAGSSAGGLQKHARGSSPRRAPRTVADCARAFLPCELPALMRSKLPLSDYLGEAATGEAAPGDAPAEDVAAGAGPDLAATAVLNRVELDDALDALARRAQARAPRLVQRVAHASEARKQVSAFAAACRRAGGRLPARRAAARPKVSVPARSSSSAQRAAACARATRNTPSLALP